MTMNLKLIGIKIFLLCHLHFEENLAIPQVGLILRPSIRPVERDSRPIVSGVEKFYGNLGTPGCPGRKFIKK